MTKIKVYNEFNLPPCEFTNPGEAVIDDLALFYDDDGVPYVDKTGKKINVQDKIDSFKDECDLSLIVERILASGVNPYDLPVSILDDVVDVTDIPTNIHDIYKVSNQKESLIAEYEAKLAELKAQEKQKVENVEVKDNE